MKVRTMCPHCQIWQIYRAPESGTIKEVVCKMVWCKKVFDASKTPLKNHQPDHEVLKKSI